MAHFLQPYLMPFATHLHAIACLVGTSGRLGEYAIGHWLIALLPLWKDHAGLTFFPNFSLHVMWNNWSVWRHLLKSSAWLSGWVFFSSNCID